MPHFPSMSNGFIYVVDAHFIDKIEETNIQDPSVYDPHLPSCSDLTELPVLLNLLLLFKLNSGLFKILQRSCELGFNCICIICLDF